MSVRNFIDVPDAHVPDWVRRQREASRRYREQENRKLCGTCQIYFHTRVDLLNHCDHTGHRPLAAYYMDPFLKRGQ